MNQKYQQLSKIVEDLGEYTNAFCATDENNSTSDFSGEKCNDAFLMLQEALGNLKSDQ